MVQLAASRGAGSGPYLLRQYSTTSQIVLEQNPRYWGRKPAFERVVIRNMIAATQFVNVQRGTHEVAIDLSAQHAQSLRNSQRVGVTTQPSTWVFWLFANNNPSISAATPNKRFQSAVRYALDYRSFVELAGPGAIQARGSSRRCSSAHCPRIGCQPKPQPGQDRARRIRRRRPDVHRRVSERPDHQRGRLRHPRAAGPGEPRGHRAEGRAGRCSRRHVARQVPERHDGLRPVPLGPDYPDPADYLAFMPGELVGTRVGWPKGSDQALERLAARARVTTSDVARAPIYRQIQQRLNQTGPYFPLIQPTQVFASTKDLRGAVFNPLYSIDVRLPRAAG